MGRFFPWVFLLAAAACWADEEADVSFQLVDGQPVRVVYKDGRVAEWMIGRRPVKQFRTRYQITENTCTGFEGARGEFLLAFQSSAFDLRWKQNGDPKKVGQTVVIRAKGGTTSSPVKDDFTFLTNDQRAAAPLLTKDFPQDGFQAKEFSWLPGGGAEPPDSLKFVRWDTEAMQTNPETGLMENRTLTIATHPKWARTAPGFFELRELSAGSTSFFGSRFLLFVGDIWSIILKDGDRYCQISVKANLADLQVALVGYLGVQPTFEPYTFGVDEYSNALMPYNFKNYRDRWKEYEVE
ncbi:MAG: hypothetical protein HYZ71_15960 [Deltaproteobacteria bacterium]|nr:hypothetical protein [Deltaproteobacteria bacterium]